MMTIDVGTGHRMLVFDADEWRNADGDVGDNSCFWHEAEILSVQWHKNPDEVTATVVFASGKESHGHFVHMMREIPADA